MPKGYDRCAGENPRPRSPRMTARSPTERAYRGRMTEPRNDHRQQREARRSISPKVILWGIVAVLAAILILQNTDQAKVHVLFWNVKVGLWILLLGTFLLGMLFGWLIPKLRRGRGRRHQLTEATTTR